MISAIVFGDGEPPQRARELAVRSLAWLVSAVVAGVVRDVTASSPPSWPIVDVMEHAGCALLQMSPEAERVRAAAAFAKCERILVLRLGFQPEGPLVAEIGTAHARLELIEPALLLEAPSRFVERLFPDRAPIVGALLPREAVRAAASVKELIHKASGGLRLRTRMVPVL